MKERRLVTRQFFFSFFRGLGTGVLGEAGFKMASSFAHQVQAHPENFDVQDQIRAQTFLSNTTDTTLPTTLVGNMSLILVSMKHGRENQPANGKLELFWRGFTEFAAITWPHAFLITLVSINNNLAGYPVINAYSLISGFITSVGVFETALAIYDVIWLGPKAQID